MFSDSQVSFKRQQWTNLWFEGGGVWGVSYVGVIAALQQSPFEIRWDSFRNFGGVSIGSVFAMLVTIGYVWQELYTICLNSKSPLSSQLLDKPKSPWFYIQPGEQLERWLQQCLVAKGFSPSITFTELYAKTGRLLSVLVGDKERKQTIVCDAIHTPDQSVAQAVRYSCALPGLFHGGIDKVGTKKERWVDGGLYWTSDGKQLFSTLYPNIAGTGDPSRSTLTVGFIHCDQARTHFNFGWNNINTMLRLINIVSLLRSQYHTSATLAQQTKRTTTPDICLSQVTRISSPVDFHPSDLNCLRMMCVGYTETRKFLKKK